jgi:predicted nucleic acid-binding protein
LIVLDTSLLYALLDSEDEHHAEALAWYDETPESLVTTPLVLAELDYFAIRSGPAAAGILYDDVRSGAYEVEWWDSAAHEIADIAVQYADLGFGLTDASLVALAARFETTSIATFDERHFRVVRPLAGAAAFTLLPADAALA